MKARRGADRKPFFMGLGAVALVGVGALAYQATKKSDGPAATLVTQRGVPANAKPYVLGKPDAPVQITEFADFECPGCGQFATVTEPDVRQRLVSTGIARYSYYDFPLPQHANSLGASNAAACADDQGKFWEMHDRLFNGQPNWSGEATSRPKGIFRSYAGEIGLNVEQWEKCFDAQSHMARIMGNKAMGDSMQVNSTPTFIIGKRKLVGGLAYDNFKLYVDSALAEAKLAGAPATPAADQPPAIKLDSAGKRKTGP